MVIYHHFDRNDIVDNYVIHILSSLRSVSENIHFVTNSKIDETSTCSVEILADTVTMRPNRGYDFAGWKQVVLGLGRERIEAFDELNVKTLRVGMRHSAAICEDGNLYTFGQGNWGVLGHGSENFVSFNKPKLVEGLAKANVKVKDVHLGEYHTMVLGEDGSVWTWGYAGKKGMFNWMYN